ncbi:ABC transporter ATP-binding protein [Niveispirillum cyanobacteriorum]|uniref:ABC transporter ATP-binding protein n=1 Tax=Niveispirillum cyanobacteriorum TaxID=1612173 RepID=UPI0019C322EC|nr:ABC transporter ATP-binding protein [Niveispirillum cyanobacteriorum]GGE64153.1 ABC transporter permease [Niveispirillum cyanobacteriorum]
MAKPIIVPAVKRTTPTGALLRRLSGAYLGPYKPKLLAALLLMALEAAGTGAVAWGFQPLLDRAFQPDNHGFLLPFAALIMAAFFVRGTAAYGHSVLVNHVGQRIVARIQAQVYGHLIRSDLAYLHGRASGQWISHLVNDVNQMRLAVSECLTGAVNHSLTLVVLVVMMFYQDWRLGLIAFTVFPVSGWFLGRLGKRLRRIATSQQTELGNFSAVLGQTFQGARHVKAYGMEAHEEARVGITIDRLRKLTAKSYRTGASMLPINEIFSGAAVVGVIIYGGLAIADGTRTAGQLVSFIGSFMLAYQPMKALTKLNAQLQVGLAAAERVLGVLDMPPSITDRPGAAALPADATHDIRFAGVHFSYDGEKEALDGVDIMVPAGRTVALVGASGSGKTTVLNLIPRFYEVTDGSVTVAGHDVRDLTLSSLRASIALVAQETALFDDTILANIAYGRPSASRAEVEAAARDAAAHEFIMELPHGYDTVVGEMGLKLSGGQRQRIAIARAMLKNAPILLLDEATSALDSASERAVQDALRRLAAGRTTLVIAHRLSTIADADHIYVMDQGRVVEQGTHAELLAAGGAYARYQALQGGA